MVYFGPANLARQYFVDMGYEPANRQTTPDFLVSVTDPNGRTPRDDGGKGSKPIPKTPLEFEQYYRESEIRKMNLKDIEAYKSEFVNKEKVAAEYRQSARQEQARHTRGKVRGEIDLSPMPAYQLHRARIRSQSPCKPGSSCCEESKS
jgi:ATP-binding cassette, subfamily G (WHITE), member 2, SNQ2